MEYATMDHRYTRECERPEYDEEITKWLDEYRTHPWGGTEYTIAIYHSGFIYRTLYAEGLDSFAAASKFLRSIGLVDILNDLEIFRGYSSVFATPEVRKLRDSGEFNMLDIPRNPPPPPKPKHNPFWDDEDDEEEGNLT